MATLINLSNSTPAAPGGALNVLWQSDASSPTNVSSYINFANITVPIIVNITTASGLTLINQTVSTLGSQFSSPQLVLSGTAWNGSASVTDTWQISNVTGYDSGAVSPTSELLFHHSAGAGPSRTSVALDSTVGSFTAQNTSFAIGAMNATSYTLPSGPTQGSAVPLTAAANASAGTTTYTWSTTAGFVPTIDMYVTVAGFTNGANNGRFQVQSATTSSLILYNAGGVAETHAATATVDTAYSGSAGLITYFGAGSGSFSIAGTAYAVNQNIESWPNVIGLALTAQGDTTDAAWFRIVNTVPINSSHGFELGAIDDGAGTAPIVIQMGVFNGFTGLTFAQYKVATGGGNTSSYPLVIQSQYWTGSATALNSWSIQDVLGSGSNPTTTLTIQQSGTSGSVAVNVISALTSKTLTVNTATPTGAASTVSFGTTTATTANAGANGDVPAQVVGYLEIDIAGTKFKLPYYAV